jgi:acyl-CoA thioester hydrolase
MPVTSQLRVRYAETDQMHVVYYANYLVWFEVGRGDLMRAAGLSYESLEQKYGCILPVAEARCRYRASAHYDDRIEVETLPSVVRGSMIKFAYKIYRVLDQKEKERELLAQGETTHFVCGRDLKRKQLPEAYEAALKALMPEALPKKS